jgi:DNA-binding NarL/FixJ family response regulator
MPKIKPQAAAAADENRLPGERLRQALKWLAAGHPMADVAKRLNRRPQVVARHIAAELARLGVGSAAQALQALAAAGPASDAAPAADEPAVAEEAATADAAPAQP